MSSGGSLAYFAELFKALSCFLQGALHGCSSQRPSSGRLHPTSNQALLPGTLALLFPISLRIFLGQGLVCPSSVTPLPPPLGWALPRAALPPVRSPCACCPVSGAGRGAGRSSGSPDRWRWGGFPLLRHETFFPFFASLFRDFPFPG